MNVDTRLKKTSHRDWRRSVALAVPLGIASILFLFPVSSCTQSGPGAGPAAEAVPTAAGPPPSGGGFFPLREVRRGMTATAWTVFTGTQPEAMEVEILGVLRGARGPGHDMILVRLHGAKPEYTGVVAGMSGSPVYIGNRLLGSLSYRIGLFSKEPIAGITPIEQMLEVRDLPIAATQAASIGQDPAAGVSGGEPKPETVASGLPGGMNLQAMDTPLVMSGFDAEAIRLWREKMAGTGLETVAAGGVGGASSSGAESGGGGEPSATAAASVEPGSAVSMQLVRGDLEIAATCTVTYIDPKQLLACGHPVLQAGPVSLPMTTAEVLDTLASPLDAFKIVNTGETIGAFTEDRDAAIRGVLGQKARMIPVHIALHEQDGEGQRERKLNVEVLDVASITPQAVMVTLFEALLQNNGRTAETSYHVTGSIDLEGYPLSRLDQWSSAGGSLPAPMEAAVQIGQSFAQLYSNGSRHGAVRGIEIAVEEIPRRVGVELETARLVTGNIVHAGDTLTVEATIRPWREAPRNVRIPVTLPSRLAAGNLRMLVSDAGTLDRTLNQPRTSNRPVDVETVMAEAGRQHREDRIYVSLLTPDTQAGVAGQTLSSLPLSVANALEPLRAAQDARLNGESALEAGDAAAGGVLSGFQILNVRIEAGGGLN